ncbi:fatty acid desaturase family protein [Synechococcus sp. PCC 7336]|uniref:fatty acid desaturase family protein n=1 Tax=Synechococcus sp. PCC 7336 TaxID=195250 RepID=UPI000344FB35|nr:fatty acid desaturase family protein [Synechococcus sp. PCC 7336]
MSDEPKAVHPSEPAAFETELSFDRSPKAAAAYLSPQQVFSKQGLQQLNQRSDRKGTLQLAGHAIAIGASGYCWLAHLHNLWIGLPALAFYGFSIAILFMPLHECVHRTAFASNRANDIVAWFAGLFSLYNSTFYWRYHQWHHRYTRIPGKDPELADLTPTNVWEYLWLVSGIPWWIGKLKTHFLCATGQMADMPYIPNSARRQVQRSVQVQLLVYAFAIAASLYLQQPWFVLGWLLPLAIGQPILRMILLAEHTDCSLDANPLTNTRTTLTWAPLRFLLWNMPFHAEHHFCPSIPFHALGSAHQKLRPHLNRVDPGYLSVNLKILQKLRRGERVNSPELPYV